NDRALPRQGHRTGRFYTIAEVSELLGVCTRTVRRWIDDGMLIKHKFGTTVRIAESDLKVFVATHRAP
ncbi:MAG: helix-turn-helix domain-containing protein, partial [Pseudolabrys sp.]